MKIEEMSQRDMINCQVTDSHMDKFNATGMILCVFLRETGVRSRRKGNH